MLLKASKTMLVYGLIVAAGLVTGRYAPHLLRLLTPNYTSGNFTQYYPDLRTRVIVYGTAECPYCIMTRAYLLAHQIPFADLDVVKSDKGRREFEALGGKGVPLILIGERRITGFNEAAIDAALQKLTAAQL